MLLHEHVKPFDATHCVIRMPSWNSVRSVRVKQSKLFVTVTRTTNDGFADDSDANDSSDLGKRQLYLPTHLLLLAQNRGWLYGCPELTCWRRDSGHLRLNEWMNENLYIAHKKLPHKTLRWREHSLIPNNQRVKSVMPRFIIALSAVNHYDAPLDVSTIQCNTATLLPSDKSSRNVSGCREHPLTHSRQRSRKKNPPEEAMRVDIHACLFLRVQTSV